MSVRGPYRRHSLQFNQICTDIRNGKLGRREALKTHNLSANLMQLWLTQFDRGELDLEEAAASTVAEYEAHITALERKVASSRWNWTFLKKHRGYNSLPATRHHRSSAARTCSIRRGCQVIALPRSTYYYRPSSAERQIDDLALVALINDVHDEFPSYGYRRVTLALRTAGHVINHKRVARVMKEHSLPATHRRRFKPASGDEADLAIFPNLYRNVIPTVPDRVWVADITYIRIDTGFAYLAVVLDACSRKVIGYALSKRIDTPLALAALHGSACIKAAGIGHLHPSHRLNPPNMPARCTATH